MADAILWIDDDPCVLDGYTRRCHNQFNIECAVSAEQGFQMIAERGPFAVVVSDLKMPGMNGIQFLSKVREQAPDTVRILLTGHADLQAAIEAINHGQIFRFLTKPCTGYAWATALHAGLRQHHLITAEQELLEQTLSGSIKVLCEMLSLANPTAFGRSSRIARYAEGIVTHLQLSESWEIITAAMLSQIGCVILPEKVLEKVYQGKSLTSEEAHLLNQHPLVGYDLLVEIPRMARVAEIIKYQDQYYDGVSRSGDHRQGTDIPIGARILRVALDFDWFQSTGKTKTEAFNLLQQRKDWYDPDVVTALKAAFYHDIKYEMRTVVITDLRPGMILSEDVRSDTNALLALNGQVVTKSMMMRLQSFTRWIGIRQPFTVLIEMDQEDSDSSFGGVRVRNIA